MSNHQLATMILKTFLNDTGWRVHRGSESFSDFKSDDNKYILPNVKDADYHIQCDKGKDLGKLIGGSELSKISITQVENKIGFIFNSSDPILWDNGDKLDSGNYGEVKKFTFQEGGDEKSVAIKKFNYYKSDYDKIVDEKTGKVKKVSKGIKYIIEGHLNEVGIINRIMDICDKDRENCIFYCDIIPVSVIKDNQDNFTFGEGDNQHGYIALELMDGTLSQYYNKIRKKIKKISGDVGSEDDDDDDDEGDGDDASAATYKDILDDIKKVLITTAKALQCFSDRGWYYTDFKPSNIMYRCDNNKITIRIIDVGSLVSEQDMEKGYILTYGDIEGSENNWILYNETNSNFKYLHVYLIGVLLIRILQRSFKIKIKDYSDFGEYLHHITNTKGRIEENHITEMIDILRGIIIKKSFDNSEKYVSDIHELFNKTILSQYDDDDKRKIVTDPKKKRFSNEEELINYLENTMFEINK